MSSFASRASRPARAIPSLAVHFNEVMERAQADFDAASLGVELAVRSDELVARSACEDRAHGAGTATTQARQGQQRRNLHLDGLLPPRTAIVGVGLGCQMDPADIGKFSSIFRTLVAGQRGNGRVSWRDVYRAVGLEREFVE